MAGPTITVNWRFNLGSENAKAITYVPDNNYPGTGYTALKTAMGFSVQPKYVAPFILHNLTNGQMLLARYDRKTDAVRVFYPNAGQAATTSGSLNTGTGVVTTGGSVLQNVQDTSGPGLEVQAGADLSAYTGDTLVIGE